MEASNEKKKVLHVTVEVHKIKVDTNKVMKIGAKTNDFVAFHKCCFSVTSLFL